MNWLSQLAAALFAAFLTWLGKRADEPVEEVQLGASKEVEREIANEIDSSFDKPPPGVF